jgi:hypothetical protein
MIKAGKVERSLSSAPLFKRKGAARDSKKLSSPGVRFTLRVGIAITLALSLENRTGN